MGTGGISNKITQINNYIKINDITMPLIPDDQYLCPLCGRIPEILNIHTDNGHMELKCKYHDN